MAERDLGSFADAARDIFEEIRDKVYSTTSINIQISVDKFQN